MIRRASIPGARPPPGRRRRRRAGPPRPSSARASRGQANRLRRRSRASHSKRVVLGPEPHRLLGRDEGGEHRDQRDLVAPVLIERLDPAQVVEPVGRESRFPPPAPARAAWAGVSPASMWPCTVSQEPGQRPPLPALQHQTLERRARRRAARRRRPARPAILVTASTARTRRAARCRPAATSRDGTARRARSPCPRAWERPRRTRRCRAPRSRAPTPGGSCGRDRRSWPARRRAARPPDARRPASVRSTRAQPTCGTWQRGDEPPHLARAAAEPARLRRLFARLEEELQPEADPHDRPARRGRLADGVAEAGRAPGSARPARSCPRPASAPGPRCAPRRDRSVSVAACPPAASARTTLFRLFTP